MTKKGKRRTWRKLLSALLVMNMLLGTMSTSAFAADLTEEPVVEEAAAAQPESDPQLLVSEETVSTPGPEPEVVEEEPVAEVTEEEPAIEVTEEEPVTEVIQEEAAPQPVSVSEPSSTPNTNVADSTEYADISEFNAAIAEIGDTDDEASVRAVIAKCLAIYDRLSPEDQAAQAEAYAYIQSYAEDLGQSEVETLASLYNPVTIQARVICQSPWTEVSLGGDDKAYAGSGTESYQAYYKIPSLDHFLSGTSYAGYDYGTVSKVVGSYHLPSSGNARVNSNVEFGTNKKVQTITYWVSKWKAPHTHSYSWVQTTAPTCYSNGEETYKCSCGATNGTRTIPANEKYHTWGNWYNNGDGKEQRDCNYNVHHEYRDIQQCTATWKNGYTDTPIKTETVEKGISDEDLKGLYPANPSREKYEFTGWSDPERDSDGNITITAQWKPKEEPKEEVTATWKDGYTDTPIKTETVEKGISDEDLKGLYPANPSREKYEFTGWSDPERDSDGNITITAQWKPKEEPKEEVTATWKDGYTDTPIKTETVEKGISNEDLKEWYPANPSREGYEFTGWSDPERDKDGNITITAEWKPKEEPKEVTAIWKDGYTDTPIKTETVVKGISNEDLKEWYPANPSREGYEFTGWSDPERDKDGNITITAEWKPKEEPEEEVTATWKNGYTDTPIKTETVAKDITDEVLQRLYPEDPARDGFDFDGWEVERDSDGNITITAQWKPTEEPEEEVTATWKDGYTDTPIKTETVAKDITDEVLQRLYPEDPARDGFDFDGWEVERDSDGNITITAQWKPKEEPKEEVTATWNDGYTDTPIKTEPVAKDITDEELRDLYPEDPTREGYNFDGWEVERDSDGNITITAQWTAVTPVPTPEDPTPENPTPENPTPGNPGTTTPGTTTPVETPVTPGAPAVTPIVPAITPAVTAPTAPVTPIVTLAAPTPTPVTPAVTPAALTPVTPALTPNAEEATPGGQTETQAVPDEETPLANADLEDEEVPLAGNSGRWALINFVLMNLSVFESLMLLIGYFIQTKKSSEEEEEDEKERKLKKKGIIRIVSLPIAIISLIAFFLTENIWLPTRLVDQYTLMMAVIAVIQTIMVVLSRKEEVTEEEEPEAEMA